MTDSTNFEQRASTIYNADILQQLASLSTDLSAPLALLLTGLLVKVEPLATSGDPPIAKVLCLANIAFAEQPFATMHAFGLPSKSSELPTASGK